MATPAAGYYLVETVPVQPNCDRRPENTISTVSRRERGCETDEDKLCVRMHMCLSWSSYAEPSLTPVLFHNLPHAYPRPQRVHPCRGYPPSMVRHPRKRGRALTLLHRKQEFFFKKNLRSASLACIGDICVPTPIHFVICFIFFPQKLDR